jgi:hypothetical protein
MTDSMGPEPFMKGTFAVYELPDGGRMLAYREEGNEETNRFVIPAALMKLVEAQQRGEKINPLQLMKTMMGK